MGIRGLFLAAALAAVPPGVVSLASSWVSADMQPAGAAADAAASTSGAREVRSMDSDDDGRLSRAEHATGAKALFRDMDTDRDGFVTPAEMDAAQARAGKPAADTRDEPSSADKIAAIDTDKDDLLSAQEHADGAWALFDRMDEDADGFLTADEIQKGHDDLLREDPGSDRATVPAP